MNQDNINKIYELVNNDRYSIKQHAHQRTLERSIFSDDIEATILLGEVIEENFRTKPCPTYLFMRFIKNSPLYVVCALSHSWLYIITVYWYDPNKWIDPWTRKK